MRLPFPGPTSVCLQAKGYKIGLMCHLLEAIKGSTLSLVAALKTHEKLKVMRDEDLLAGLPGGTLCVCTL